MRFRRSRLERVNDSLKKVYSSLSNKLAQMLYIFIKSLKLVPQNTLKYSFYLRIVRLGKVYHVKLALNSSRDISPSSTWRTHSCNKLDIKNILKKVSLDTVKPPFIVNPLSQQLQYGLAPENLFSRHIQVIYKNHHPLSVRDHLGLCSSNQL